MERLLSELLNRNKKQVLRIVISSVRNLSLNDWNENKNNNDADLNFQ